jgi:hypothetical protein
MIIQTEKSLFLLQFGPIKIEITLYFQMFTPDF